MADNGTYIAKIPFREVLQSIFRYKWKMLFTFLAISGAVVGYVTLMPNIYQSEAGLVVRPGREFNPQDASGFDMGRGTGPRFEDLVLSEGAIIQSRHLAEAVAVSAGPEMVLYNPDTSPPLVRRIKHMARYAWSFVRPPAEESEIAPEYQAEFERNVAAATVMGNLLVSAKGNTIRVGYESKDPFHAQDMLKIVLDEYHTRHIELHESQASPEFVKARLTELEDHLYQCEDALADFQARNNVASLESEKEGLIGTIGAMESEITNLRAQEDAAIQRLAVLGKSLEGRSERMEVSTVVGETNSVAQFLTTELLELQLQERDLKSRYTDSFRTLVEVRAKIVDVEAELEKQRKGSETKTFGIDQSFAAIESRIGNEEADLAGFVASRNTKEKEIDKLRADLRTMTGHETTMAKLRRNVMTCEAAYMSYKQNLARVEAYAALDQAQMSNVVTLQEPTQPLAPVRPRKGRNIALGLVLGLFAAVGLGCFLDYTDDTFSSEADVEKMLALPVLTVISEEDFTECT